MSNIEKFLGAGVLVAIVIAIGAFLHVPAPVVFTNTGAVSPTDISSSNFTEVTASNGVAIGTSQQFQVDSYGYVTSGGSASATTTLGNAVLTVSDLASTAVLSLNQGAAAGGTYTLPASSTMSTYLPTAGQCSTIQIVNSTTTVGTNITIAGGTGTSLLKVATSSAVISNPKAGSLSICRKTNTDFLVQLFNAN